MARSRRASPGPFFRGGGGASFTRRSVAFMADDVTLDDLRESVTTLEDTARTARRVLGGAHPATEIAVRSLECSREALGAAEESLSNP